MENQKPVDSHVEQQHSHWCIPACVAMMLKARGRSVTQENICVQWQGSRQGFSLADAAKFLQLTPPESWEVTSPAIRRIRIELVAGQWMIVQVFIQVMARIHADRSPPRVSVHGPLPESFGRHAIVLVGATSDGIDFLDPYFPSSGQPFHMTDTEFAQAWQGAVLF